MQSVLKKLWSDPVWSKVIASAIYAVLTGSLVSFAWVRANSWSLAVSLVLTLFLVTEGLLIAVCFRRSAGSIISAVNEPVYYYKRSLRRFAAALAFVLPIGCLGTTLLWNYLRCRSNGQMVIFVADFESEGKLGSFRMTRIIFERLQAVLKPYSDTRVELLGRPIGWKKGIAEALTTCDRRRGAVVIWGDYDSTQQMVAVSIHFDLLPNRDSNLALWSQSREARYGLGDLEHFVIQDQVSKQLAYASLFAKALTRFRAGDYNAAITAFTDALEQSEGSDQNPAYFFRASALEKIGRYQEAINDFTHIVDSDERYGYALTNRGACRIAIDDAVGAVLDLTRAIAIAPTDALAYNNRGGAFYALGRYEESLADYGTAIRYSRRDDPLPYVGRGNANDRLGKFDQAMADYEYALRLDVHEPTAYLNRGIALLHHGDTDPAIQDFTRAIQLKADFVEAYRARAICYMREGRRDDAVRDYRSAIAATRSPQAREPLENELKDLQQTPLDLIPKSP